MSSINTVNGKQKSIIVVIDVINKESLEESMSKLSNDLPYVVVTNLGILDNFPFLQADARVHLVRGNKILRPNDVLRHFGGRLNGDVINSDAVSNHGVSLSEVEMSFIRRNVKEMEYSQFARTAYYLEILNDNEMTVTYGEPGETKEISAAEYRHFMNGGLKGSYKIHSVTERSRLIETTSLSRNK